MAIGQRKVLKMKKIIATLIVLTTVNTMAKTFEVCLVNEEGITKECRLVTDNLELGMPSQAAPEQVGGDINPVAPSEFSNGTNGKLYKTIDAVFKALGATGPAVQQEAP
jgi:hypothetical protein